MAYSSQGGGRSASTPQQTKPAQAAKPAEKKANTIFSEAELSLEPVEHGSLHDAMIGVARDLSQIGVSKSVKVGDGNYAYNSRGIEGLMNAVGPLLAKHGIIALCRFEIIKHEQFQSKSGGGYSTRSVVNGEFTYRFKTEEYTSSAIGEATDTFDKATNKAMSVATKYNHALTFSIPFAGLEDNETSGKDGKEPAQPHYGTPGTQGVEGARPYTEEEIANCIDTLRMAPTREALHKMMVSMRDQSAERGDQSVYLRLREEFDQIRAEKGWVNQSPHTVVDNDGKGGLFND